uniref:Uncharacterized protein n=1 Tax=Anopheles maculatus TaxID=74869 RepID=A0A182T1W1_9DIPT
MSSEMTNAIPAGISSGATSTKTGPSAAVGGGEVMFQFFGPKIDSSRVREAMEKMTERGRIGNVSLVPGTKLSFRQDVGLMLQVGYISRSPKLSALAAISVGRSGVCFYGPLGSQR